MPADKKMDAGGRYETLFTQLWCQSVNRKSRRVAFGVSIILDCSPLSKSCRSQIDCYAGARARACIRIRYKSTPRAAIFSRRCRRYLHRGNRSSSNIYTNVVIEKKPINLPVLLSSDNSRHVYQLRLPYKHFPPNIFERAENVETSFGFRQLLMVVD